MSFTRLIPLDRYNWELAVQVRISPEQEAYTPSVLYSLAQAKFENLMPYGIQYRDSIVGLIMYGDFGGICWISRIMVDQEYQRIGIGTTALRQMIEMLERKISCKEIRTSYARGNYAAASFFEEMGFEPLEDALSEEIVMTYTSKYKKSF